MLAPSGRRRALAIDGKTVRGSRATGPDGEQPARHLLAAIDKHTGIVLGQQRGRQNQRDHPLHRAAGLTAIDLSDVVMTADALHSQREHVATLAGRGAH